MTASATPEGRDPSAGLLAAFDGSARLPAGLPVPVDDGAADHLRGARLPRLALEGTHGVAVDVGDPAAGTVVLYIYPMTGRPGVDLPDGWDAIPGARGCTPEACAFRDHYADLTAVGVQEVLGLSTQSLDHQREAAARLHLPFPLLADPGRLLGGALRLPIFEAGGRTLYRRLTLIVRGGAVEHLFYPVFPPDGHAGEVLDWLRGRASR